MQCHCIEADRLNSSAIFRNSCFPPVRRCNEACCVDSGVLRSSAPQFVMFKVNLVGSGQSA